MKEYMKMHYKMSISEKIDYRSKILQEIVDGLSKCDKIENRE